MKRTLSVLLAMCLALSLIGAEPQKHSSNWEFLSRTDIGAKAFTDAHPDWDGRGVLIAVCDSGVDLGTPGLLTTSDGKPKIVDARVFSDEGKVDLEKAERSSDEHGSAVHAKDGKWLYGLANLPVKPPEGAPLYVAYFKEEAFKNSDANGGDLNDNGRADDVYGLLAFKGADGTWVAYLDANGDGDLADEKPIGDFSQTHQAFQLRGRDVHGQANLMTFALNLWPDEKKAALYMADGSHGTHVAGICAGQAIAGQAGFDGIAPGAQILALKIGDNTLTGGSTTPGSMLSAWRYAVKKAGELGMPLVIQMSYGTGSEEEGRAVAERLIDELLDENPGVVATVSNGNEGPGLSSTGLPACARDVLSIGAVLNRSSAKELYGVTLSQDEMFSFSSRGGEMDKPDVVAPGFASSTVPVYEGGRDVFRGTSMASPQAAGACALLLSAAKAQGLPVRRDVLVASVERGAVPIEGYGPADQGHGLIDVPRAWRVYQALCARKPAEPVLFRAQTESPEMAPRKGPAVFWRGAFYPDGTRTQEIAVEPVFPRGASADFKANFYRAFDVSCDAGWLSVGKDAAYCKAGQPARIPIRFDAARLSKPGCYQAVIAGFARGEGSGDLGPDWTVPVTVVVPEPLEAAGRFRNEKDVRGLEPAKLERHFYEVGPRTGSLSFDVRLPPGEKGALSVTLFDPQGREARATMLRPGRERYQVSLGNADLVPGVWELDLCAFYANTAGVSATVAVQALPLVRPVPEALPVRLGQGQAPSASLTLVSGLPFAFRGEGEGQVVGSATDRSVKVHAAAWSKGFTVAPGESGAVFELSLSREDFNKFTDIAIQVLDADGKALASDGFTFRKQTVEFVPPKGAKPGEKYTLKVSGATADPEEDAPSWTLRVREFHPYSEAIAVEVKQGREKGVTLYPDHESALALQLEAVPPALPEGGSWVAKVTLKGTVGDGLQLPLEVELEPAR